MKLTFLDTNTTREISEQYIVKDSVKYEYKLLKDLSPSSNRVTLKLIKECPEVELIIAAKKDVKVEGDFVGYLSNNYTWTVTNSGQQALQITIEDVGTRLLKKSFSKETLYKGKASDVLNAICQLAEVVRADNTEIDKNVCFIAEGTYAETLSNLLRECGYTYYFTNEGKLAVKKFNFSETATYVVDRTNLFSHSNKAITLTKKVKQYGLIDVSWKGIETLKNVYIYKDETGKDSTHPYCYIEVKDFYPSENGNYVQATNLNDSREIAFIENIQPEVSYTGNIEYSITQHSPTTLDVRVENKSSSSSHLTKLQCRADATVYSEINSTTAGEADFEKYETEAVCIHSKEDVEEYANLLSNYYKYCNQTYSFYSTSDMELGNVCNLKDESFSGLDVKVYLIEKKVHNGYYEYSAVATSNFDIDNATSEIVTKPVITPSQGPAGPSGEDAKSFIVSISPTIFLRDLRRTDTQSISVIITSSGYEGDINVNVSRGTLGEATTYEGYYANQWIVPYNNDFSSMSLTASLEGATTQNHTINVVDITEYNKYFGTNPPSTGLLNGDSYFDKTNLYVYKDDKWVGLSEAQISTAERSEICAKAQKDVLDTIEPGTVVSSEFAYIMNLITDLITASHITMTERGIIQSSGVNDSSVGNDGFLTVDGYRLEGSTSKGTGVLRAKSAYLDNLSVKKGSLVDVAVTGELDGKYFSTIAKSDATTSVNINRPSATHYSKAKVRQALREATKSELQWSNEYYGTDVTIYKVTEIATSGSISGRNVSGVALTTDNWTYLSLGTLYLPESGNEGTFVSGTEVCLTGTGFSNESFNIINQSGRYKPGFVYEQSPNYGQSMVNVSDYIEYSLADQSFFNNFSSLTSGETYVTTGTAVIDGVTFSGTFTVYYRPDSITLTQDGKSVTVDLNSYHIFGSNLSLSFKINLSGIQAENIYPVAANTGSIGIASKRFASVFSNSLDTGSIASTGISVTGEITATGNITGAKVYGAVFN